MTSKEKQASADSAVTSCQYDMNNKSFVNNEEGTSSSGHSSNSLHVDKLNNSSTPEGNEKLDPCSCDLEDNEIGTAPIEMLSEFLSAVMSRNYEAALNYCKIILQYEPTNKIVQEFYPLIEERLKQAKEGLLEVKSDSDSSIDEEEDSSVHSGTDSEVEFEDSNANSTFEDSNANSTSDDYSTADNGGWTSTINTDSDRKYLKRNFLRFSNALSPIVTEKEEPEVSHDDNSNPKPNLENSSEFELADSCGNKLQALVL